MLTTAAARESQLRRSPSRLRFVSAACLVAAAAVGCGTSTSSLLKLESASPARLGTAILVTENISFGGSDAWVFVRDNRKPGSPVKLGGSYASDGSRKMKQAVWSRDGTLFAVQARVGESAGKGFSKYAGTYFVTGYDFKRHRRLAGGTTPAASSRKLERLFRERGGQGKIVFTRPYLAEGKPVSAREAKDYGKLHAD